MCISWRSTNWTDHQNTTQSEEDMQDICLNTIPRFSLKRRKRCSGTHISRNKLPSWFYEHSMPSEAYLSLV
jgi:hypothetical protein